METLNGMLKCPCCGAFITQTWAEKDALRRQLNREYAQLRRDKTRVRKFSPKTKHSISFDSKKSKVPTEEISGQLTHIEEQNAIILERIARIEERQREYERRH